MLKESSKSYVIRPVLDRITRTDARRHPRIPLRIEARIKDTVGSHSGIVQNLSLGGCYASAQARLQVNESVKIMLKPPHWPVLDMHAVVVRAVGDGYGLNFTVESQESVIPFLFLSGYAKRAAQWWNEGGLIPAHGSVVYLVGLPRQINLRVVQSMIAPYVGAHATSIMRLPEGPIVTVHVSQSAVIDALVKGLHGSEFCGDPVFAVRGDSRSGQMIQMTLQARAEASVAVYRHA